MGEVFAAENIRTGRPVAVKLLRQDTKAKSSAVARFRQEARAAGSINSDHVTQVLDVEEDPEHGVVLVFELLEGESLIDRLKRTGPIPMEELHSIIEQVWMGLADAHRAGIVHRDLKPSNVFLERRPDGTTRVKILDFGISKVPKEAGGETLTEMGQSLGTFSFMPPEQIGKAKTVDHRADIYACATLIYQSLTGQLPYSARNILVMVEMKTKTDARSLREALTSPVDPRLEAFVSRGLQRDPDKRFQSATDALAVWRELRVLSTSSHAAAPGSNPAPSSGSPIAHTSSGSPVSPTGLRLGQASHAQSHGQIKVPKLSGSSPAIVEAASALPRLPDMVEMTTEETAATLAMPMNRFGAGKPGTSGVGAAVAALRASPAPRPYDKANAPPLEPRLDSAAAAAGISASPTAAGVGSGHPPGMSPQGTTPMPRAPLPSVGPGGTQPVMVRSSHELRRADEPAYDDAKNNSGNLPVHPAGYYIPPGVAASLARTSQAHPGAASSAPSPRPPAEAPPQTPPGGQPALPRTYDDAQGGADIATTVYRPTKPGESQSGAAVAVAPRKKRRIPLVIVLVGFLVLGFLAVGGVMYLFRPHG
jgi:eukaryotic-like serine/threonine-protein kinase